MRGYNFLVMNNNVLFCIGIEAVLKYKLILFLIGFLILVKRSFNLIDTL